MTGEEMFMFLCGENISGVPDVVALGIYGWVPGLIALSIYGDVAHGI